MQTCPNCRASIGDDLEWCNQCYASLHSTPEPTAIEPERPLWVRTSMKPLSATEPPRFSRWRGGATSFGPLGRVLLTLGVLVLLAICYPVLRGLVFTVGGMDVPGVGFLIMYLCVALPSGFFMLSRVWKRERVA